jgi:hypothetical protein
MALMNFNIDGVLTVEKVTVPADGITALSHSLFRGEKIIVRYNGDELTRGQDFIPDRIDDRLYFQKNVCLFTALKILNESLFGQEIEVEYFACGDYINAEIWNEYPSSASLKASLASKVDNSDFTKEVKRIDSNINAESTARADADNILQDNINIETNLRIAEDEKLQTNINNEATARADADNTLQNNINKEAAARESADNEIRNELSSETNLRLAGDAVLQEKIDAEMSTRAENDSSLQSQISDLKTKFESFVPGLTYKVVSVLPTADILNDVIYLVPAGSSESGNVYNEYIYIDGNWELIGTTATTQAITVDSALSATSTNPVQNKVINEALSHHINVYIGVAELNSVKETSIELTLNTDNTIKLINALDAGEQFIDWFSNISTNKRFGINNVDFGDNINLLKIIKYSSSDAVAFAYMDSGAILNRLQKNGILGDWVNIGHVNKDGNQDDGTLSICGDTGEVNTGVYGNGEYYADLGLSDDIMTWPNGTYRISHLPELTNTPSQILTGRLEHFNLKRWQGNHNPYNSNHGSRISIFYGEKGDVYTRYQESGAKSVKEGGVYTVDTGWRKVLTEANIDSALSSTSTNPVQNKVIAAEISTLKSKAYSQEITGYTVKNSSYYKDPGVTKNMYKKNGIAFVNLQVQCLSPSDGNRLFITGLPPAAISLYFEARSDNDVNELNVSINTLGELLLADGTQNAIYRIAFSYPIDD